MSVKTTMAAAAVLTGAALSILGPAMGAGPATAATKYPNCKALNADYPHGVGKPGAVDSTSGTPVTEFTVDADLYNANTSRDRDGDGIACEQN
ncbi:excalibur calcium-binding domain-containing protein [Gordonia sp. ABSL1-1]|uniref:excalibur calcium-binding domain-containing protein n=1 Tax=Gordonia sp. ABSL1-1 TaxID=3053923 RepID=UPI0025730C86|nr:excalibur calcium-binding domain-containing protein [Gordonia sp. ABSL1-1]MDL9936034.1 excalibur calcium-binding domain-containing protein [Gordonia sp. ABSL1-1]